MNRPLLVTAVGALLAAVSFSSAAQVLVETIPERRARCENEFAKLLPELETKVADYASRAPKAIADAAAIPRYVDAAMSRATFVGEGARLLRVIDPGARACGVAAPEVGDRFSALSVRVNETRILVMNAELAAGDAQLRAKGINVK